MRAIPLDRRCPDDAASTAQFLLQAAEQADCVITIGGMSVGKKIMFVNKLKP